jgi:predicted membrane protein
LPIALVGLVGDVSFFVLFCVFPDGRFVPRWTRWAAAAWAAWVLPHTFLPELPRGQGPLAALIEVALAMIGIGLVGSLVVAQVYRYRNASTQAQRQQTKWVVFGFATSIGAFVGMLLMGWVFGLTPFGIPQVLYDLVTDCVITLVALLVPLSIAIAIRNYRLWDIDLIINRAIVYGMLSAVLATVFAVTDALLLPFVVNLIVGEANDSLNVGISAVIIAVLFEPLRRRFQKVVDKLSDRLAGGNGMSEAPG